MVCVCGSHVGVRLMMFVEVGFGHGSDPCSPLSVPTPLTNECCASLASVLRGRVFSCADGVGSGGGSNRVRLSI